MVPLAVVWLSGMGMARAAAAHPAALAAWLGAGVVATGAAWWVGLGPGCHHVACHGPARWSGCDCRAPSGSDRWSGRHRVGYAVLLLAAALVGGCHYLGGCLLLSGPLEGLVGEPLRWQGTVIREPVTRGGRLDVVVRVHRVAPGGSGSPREGCAVGATVLVRVKGWREGAHVPAVGEMVSVAGRAAWPSPPRNPGDFDYAAWLRAQGVSAVIHAEGPPALEVVGKGRLGPLTRLAARLRHAFLGAVRRHLPGPSGAVVEGMVLGVRSQLPAEVEDAFRLSGLAHLMAVSGSNVALVAGVVRFLLAGAGARPALVGALVTTWLFAATASGGASVGRAALMTTVLLLGRLLGRPTHPLNSLAAAALLLTTLHPPAWEDPGFWLSVGATAGILGRSGPPSAAGPPSAGAQGAVAGAGAAATARGTLVRGARAAMARAVRAGREIMGVTCAAQAAVLPICLHYFQRVSLVAPLSNLLVFPLVGVITVGGMVCALLASLQPALGVLFRPLGVVVEAVMRMAAFWSEVPGAAVVLPAPRWPHLAAYYLFLAWGWGWIRWPLLPPRGPWTRPRVVLALLMVVAAGGVAVATAPPRHVLQVVFFSVGQGDSILLWRPGGPVMLVDCGPAGETYDAGADTLLPYLRRQGIRWVDLLVLTHGHGDHVGGAPAVLGGVRVGELWLGTAVDRPGWGGGAGPDRVLRPVAGHRKVLAPGWEVEVLHPPPGTAAPTDPNDASLVLLVRYGGTSLLLAGDLEEEGEGVLVQAWAGRLPQVDILKVPHHGGPASCGEHLLRLVRPRHAVVQVGPNPFGHPAPENLRRLERAGARVWRTDRQGAVLARTDGRRLSVACMIPGPHEAAGAN